MYARPRYAWLLHRQHQLLRVHELAPDTLRKQGERWAMVNAPVVEDGHLTPAYLPGWGAEWDEDRLSVADSVQVRNSPVVEGHSLAGVRFDDRINGIGRSSGVDYR